MKNLMHHYKKHHEKLKALDKKILSFIHEAELSLVLLVSIIGISFGFVVYISDVQDHAKTSEIQRMMESYEGKRFEQFIQTEKGKDLMLKLMETKEGRGYLQYLIGEKESGARRDAENESGRRRESGVIQENESGVRAQKEALQENESGIRNGKALQENESGARKQSLFQWIQNIF